MKLAFSPDDEFLVGGSCTPEAFIWKVRGLCACECDTLMTHAGVCQVRGPGSPLFSLGSHRKEVNVVAWGAVLPQLLTASDDNTAKLWSIQPPLDGSTLDVGRAKPLQYSTSIV